MNKSQDHNPVITRFMEGPVILERALNGLPDADLDASPRNGGWTIRQNVHHIVDGDDIWKMFIKAALGNEEAEFSLEWYWARPQVEWVESWRYADRPLNESLALLKATRNHVQQLLEQAPEFWKRSTGLRKPDGETVRLSVGEVVQMQTDHLVHHVDRILSIRRERGETSG